MELKLKNVRFHYAGHPVVDGVSMSVDASDIAAICGPNGVGKSTLIKCMNRVLRAEGAIFIGPKNIDDLSRMQIARRIGYVPQDISTVFSITVLDMVLVGRRPHLSWRSSSEDTDKVIEVMKMLKIDHLALRYFNELSGGQQQKVIIARALAQEPEILLMDEPTSNLDLRHQLEVMELISQLSETKKLSVIMAVHDLNLASRYANKLIMMKDGRIHGAGDAIKVLTPKTISSVYGVTARVKTELGKPYVIPIRYDPVQHP